MKAEESLAGLGFTDLEARLYCALLRQSPASGYALAKAVVKAPANAYQALASLLQKGAVMVDEGVARAFRPVPPAELLAALQGRFEVRRAQAAEELAKIEKPAATDRIYQIKEVAPLFERAVAMIAAAEDIILFDLFPAPFERLRPSLEAARRRGVEVAGLVYEDVSPEAPFITRLAAGAPHLEERWPGAQLTLVTDAEEHLVALVARSGEAVLHGVWSDSAYLSCLQHNGLASEIRMLDACSKEDDPLARLGLLRAFPAGLRSLLRQTEDLETSA